MGPSGFRLQAALRLIVCSYAKFGVNSLLSLEYYRSSKEVLKLIPYPGFERELI